MALTVVRRNSRNKKREQGQTVIEYMSTVLWAVLVLSIMVAVLFKLGIFSTFGTAPKAQPGGCYVERPDGPGSTQFISLSGLCSDLEPQYVASFGQSPKYQIIINRTYFDNRSFTIVGWMFWPVNVSGTNYDKDLGWAWSGPSTFPSGADNGFGLFVRANALNNPDPATAPTACSKGQGTPGIPCWYMNFYDDDLECGYGPSPGHWYQFGGSWNNKTRLQTIWVDGAANCTRTSAGYLWTGNVLSIGSAQGTWNSGAYMFGEITNVQLYNTSLTGNDILALYDEGAGGPPIALNNLEGWWPLNGNADDYSGNGGDGVLYNSSYLGVWSNKYNPP